MPASSSRRRFGRARKLPSGRWQARYPGPDSRDRAAPNTFPTKTDAARFLAAVEVDMGRGVWLDPLRSGVTLREYSQAWLAERTVRGRPLAVRTRETYQYSLDRWVLPALGGLPLDRINPAAVRRWHAETSAATGPTAARQAYASSTPSWPRPLQTTPSPGIRAGSRVRARPAVTSDRCWTSTRCSTSPRTCPRTSGASSTWPSGLPCASASC